MSREGVWRGPMHLYEALWSHLAPFNCPSTVNWAPAAHGSVSLAKCIGPHGPTRRFTHHAASKATQSHSHTHTHYYTYARTGMHRSWAKALMQRNHTSRQAAEHPLSLQPTTHVSQQPRQQFMRFSQAPRRPHATTQQQHCGPDTTTVMVRWWPAQHRCRRQPASPLGAHAHGAPPLAHKTPTQKRGAQRSADGCIAPDNRPQRAMPSNNKRLLIHAPRCAANVTVPRVHGLAAGRTTTTKSICSVPTCSTEQHAWRAAQPRHTVLSAA
jgi:hypothetical protein